MGNERSVGPSLCLGDFIGRRLTIRLFVGFFAAAIVLGVAHRALAAPPSNTDLSNQQWFESLLQPGGRHLPCCSIADCHVTTSRVTNAGYEVVIDDSWVAIPADRVVEQVSNPTGRAVVCYRHILNPGNSGDIDQSGIMIFCFVRPPET